MESDKHSTLNLFSDRFHKLSGRALEIGDGLLMAGNPISTFKLFHDIEGL